MDYYERVAEALRAALTAYNAYRGNDALTIEALAAAVSRLRNELYGDESDGDEE